MTPFIENQTTGLLHPRFEYSVGQCIQARDVNRNEWRNAVVVMRKSYRGAISYYVRWDPPWELSNGWVYEADVRPAP